MTETPPKNNEPAKEYVCPLLFLLYKNDELSKTEVKRETSEGKSKTFCSISSTLVSLDGQLKRNSSENG